MNPVRNSIIKKPKICKFPNLKSNIFNGVKIFIDFDDVIFNTKKFKNDLVKIFRKHEAEPEKQIKFLKENKKLNKKNLAKKIDDFLKKLNRYVFPDVDIFLKNFSKKELCLLSYGNKIFQKTKIKEADVKRYFGKVIISKENKIKNIFRIAEKDSSDKIILIDDRPENLKKTERTKQEIITVRMRRPEGRYSNLNCNEADYEVKNLREALNIIKKLKDQ